MSNPNSSFDISTSQIFNDEIILDCLERESYLQPNFDGLIQVNSAEKLEEFTKWFNSVFRLNFLKLRNTREIEIYQHLLQNLKTNIETTLTNIKPNNCEYNFQDDLNEKAIRASKTYKPRAVVKEIVNKRSETPPVPSSSNNLTNGIASPQTSQQQEKINDFKFNFKLTYDPIIESTFYPKWVVNSVMKGDNLSDYSVQIVEENGALCLLCRCFIDHNKGKSKLSIYAINRHVRGQKHLRFASDPKEQSVLRRYHEFWRDQDLIYQAHQIHFLPETHNRNRGIFTCFLCKCYVLYKDTISHILSNKHKEKLSRLLQGADPMYKPKLPLADLMMEVYEETPKNHDELVAKYGRKAESRRSESENRPSPPNCKIIKSNEENDQGLLPNRYKGHEEFFQKNEDTIKCILCNVNYEHKSLLKFHVNESHHKNKSGLKLEKGYTFYCEICNLHFRNEKDWDSHFIDGPNRHSSMADSRKSKVTEYECQTCFKVIYGDEISLSRHLSSVASKHSRKKQEILLPEAVKRLFPSTDGIKKVADEAVTEANRVIDYQTKSRNCCSDLEYALGDLYPNCAAYVFGSRISGLGNEQSDLDVFMDMGEMYEGVFHQDAVTQTQFVKKAAKLFRSMTGTFKHVNPISSARTPIVKLHHSVTKLECDVSFRHGLGVENTKFLRFCMEVQPITQQLILLLKKWSDVCQLSEHITNYALSLLAIFYLQTTNYLLSVKILRNFNPVQSRVIDGWETITYTTTSEQIREYINPYTKSLKQLLRDFFNYYANFDYNNNVVCPLMGHTLAKMQFCENPQENLPMEMRSYVTKIQNGDAEQFRGLSPFCIQDPFDLSHNLTKACQSGTVNKFKVLCTLTVDLLDSLE